MKNNTVDLYISHLLEDLGNGLTWLNKDDAGFGNIQEKYGASEIQINAISKHPKLVGIEPSVTVFVVHDDLNTKEEIIIVDKSEEKIKDNFVGETTSEVETEGAGQLLEL